MADIDFAAVEATLRQEAASRGVTYDPSDLEGIVRNTSYSVGGSTLEAALANQIRIYDVRAAPTMQRMVDSQSAQGQALYGSGADLRPIYSPAPTTVGLYLPVSPPPVPTIMQSGMSVIDPGRSLLAGELSTTSLPNRPYGDALAGQPSQAIGGGGGLLAGLTGSGTGAGLPSWVWLAGAGVVAYLLWKRS